MDTKGHKWSNLEDDIPGLCDAAFQIHRCTNQYMGGKKGKINERKEDAPGSIDLQVIERKCEPCCALRARVCLCVFTLCVRLWLGFRPLLQGFTAHVY